MNKWTECWLVPDIGCTGEELGQTLLCFMLDREPEWRFIDV